MTPAFWGRGKNTRRNVATGLILCLTLLASATGVGQTGPQPPNRHTKAPSFLSAPAQPVARITASTAVVLRSTGSNGTLAWICEPVEAENHLTPIEIPAGTTPGGKLLSDPAVLFDWPGHPQVIVLLVATDGDTIVSDRYVIPAEGEPVPDPTPTPEPIPGEKVWVLVVEESANRTASETQVLLDATFRQYLTDHDIPYRRLDKDQTAPAGFVPWIKKAADLPHCFVVGAESGKAYYDGPLPETPAAMLDLLKKYGGE